MDQAKDQLHTSLDGERAGTFTRQGDGRATGAGLAITARGARAGLPRRLLKSGMPAGRW